MENLQPTGWRRGRCHVTNLPERGIDLLTGQPANGELLAELLLAGPLAPERALRYAIHIGKALSRVHDCGAVHGSLSPWAIMVGEHGATILRPVARDSHALPYTSPEQIRGEPPDWRSDIFAYGAVLYEMAAGVPPFSGEPAAVRMAILGQAAPSLGKTSPALSAMEPVIADCLGKEPTRRRQRVQNAVTELRLANRVLPKAAPARSQRSPARTGAEDRRAAPPRRLKTSWLDAQPEKPAARRISRKWLVGMGAILIAVAAAGLFAGRVIFRQRTPSAVLRFSVLPEPKSAFPGTATISPDGRYIVFSAVGPEGHRVLWLRALEETHAKVIPGTDGAAAPFWSADSRGLGYFGGGALKTWAVQVADDGTPSGDSQTLCPAEDAAGGGTWNADGVIVFSPGLSNGLYRISAAGGEAQMVIPLDTGKEDRSYRWPHFLPDGKHFTYFALGANDSVDGVFASDLQSGERVPLFRAQSDAVYAGDPEANPAKSGYLLFIQDGDVYAQGFNPSTLAAPGKATLFLRDVGAVQTLSLAPLSVSRTGILVYQTISPATRELVWMTREGRQTGQLGEAGEWGLPRIAQDGRRVVCSRLSPERQRADLWVFDGDAMSRVVSIPGADARSPVWSPDGARVAFTSNANQTYDIYLKALNGPDPQEPLFKSPFPKYLTDWSRDGRYLLFSSLTTTGTASDVWAYSVSERRGGAVVETVHAEGYPALSPDGHWLAYQSDESGRDEVYVQSFDGISAETKRRWQVSAGGGRLPRWRADGRELFFLSGPSSVMAASVSPTSSEFNFEPPRKLFETRAVPKKSNLYDVSPDGQRLLLNVPDEWSTSSAITVMTSWMQKLQAH